MEADADVDHRLDELGIEHRRMLEAHRARDHSWVELRKHRHVRRHLGYVGIRIDRRILQDAFEANNRIAVSVDEGRR